jgi:hypothetical protein
MKRLAFVRVVLSLLLLVSQQLASTHVISHFAGSFERSVASAAVSSAQTGDEELSLAVTQHKNCSQCLAFAQLAGAISGKQACGAAVAQSRFQPLAGATADPATRIALAFRSRAPPFLS